MPNRLATTTSPYLLQHADNPVDWWPWSSEALAAARAAQKPILLSIGYAACHWCHVMAHESFEDPAIAAAMNTHFINVKVDREERPDLDQIYQHALAVLGQPGGWPLTMFLTPDGAPFWGGTYFPPEPRFGRPGFPQVLETMGRIWAEEQDKVQINTTALNDALTHLARPRSRVDLPAGLPAATARDLLQAFDTIHGGLAGAPKFPQAPILGFLWRHAVLSGDPAASHAVLHTLGRVCQGGIYDHLGGGFARYSVDAMWLVPHFEKMLSDNAQLLRLLADAYAAIGNPLFAARADETVGWLEREMLVDGAFASSLDADSDGEEGLYYVWSAREIDRVLGPDAPAFRLAFGVTDGGNWEGKTVLNRLHQTGLTGADEEAALRRSADRLLAVRAERSPPARDDKVLADWNGLTIAALTRAAGVFGRPDWLKLAERAFDTVCHHMARPDGRLAHSWRAGQRLDRGFLDDYVQMLGAALDLHAATAAGRFLEQALGWLEVLQHDHADPDDGGYFLSPSAADDLPIRAKSALDGPTPAANGALAGLLAKLYQLTGDPAHRAGAVSQLEVFAGEIVRNPAGHVSLLTALLQLDLPVQVVLRGDPSAEAYRDLHRATQAAAYPDLTTIPSAHAARLSSAHPAHGTTERDGQPAAHLCIGSTCQLPITRAGDLTAALSPQSLRAAIPPALRDHAFG
jgi:hypothetical protein